MAGTTLDAKRRDATGKRVKAIRREGRLPAVLYGLGIEPIAIELETHEASQVLARSSGSTLIDLNLEDENHSVLVREIQRDVIRRDLLHVDFLKVAMDETIRAEVPIELVGEAPAVKEGGVLVTGIASVEVEALPADLQDRISVDLEPLAEIDDSILAGDLYLGDKVSLVTDPDELVARVIYQVEEIIEEVVVEELIAEEVEPELVGEEEVGEEEPAAEASPEDE